jgi:hypothetical protein
MRGPSSQRRPTRTGKGDGWNRAGGAAQIFEDSRRLSGELKKAGIAAGRHTTRSIMAKKPVFGPSLIFLDSRQA